MRTIVSALFACLVALRAAPAQAQLGTQGDAILSAERLFGVRGEKRHEDRPAPNVDWEYSQLGIGIGFAVDELVPYNIPRLAFDYAVINKLTVGGAVGFSSADRELRGQGSATTTTFLLQPRVGFLHMFGRVAGIWARGGFAYHRSAQEDVYAESGFGLNLEAHIPIVFVEHFGMTVGFTFDQSLTANYDPAASVDYPVMYQSFALQVGLFGWL